MLTVYLTEENLLKLLDQVTNPAAVSSCFLINGSANHLETLYLSKRNITTLLSKLERSRRGEQTYCAIIKNDVNHSKYPCSQQFFVIATDTPFPNHCSIKVHALADEEYYTDRSPGPVNEKDLKREV
jgi:hypothetical protein